MMFDFGAMDAPEGADPAAGSTVTPPINVQGADGDYCTDRNNVSAEPASKKRQISTGFVPADGESISGKDAISSLLPVIKDISAQMLEYSSAMETAVRDLAASENDQKEELHQLQHEAKQVLAARGQMKRRYNGRLGTVSRVLGVIQPPSPQ